MANKPIMVTCAAGSICSAWWLQALLHWMPRQDHIEFIVWISPGRESRLMEIPTG